MLENWGKDKISLIIEIDLKKKISAIPSKDS